MELLTRYISQNQQNRNTWQILFYLFIINFLNYSRIEHLLDLSQVIYLLI